MASTHGTTQISLSNRWMGLVAVAGKVRQHHVGVQLYPCPRTRKEGRVGEEEGKESGEEEGRRETSEVSRSLDRHRTASCAGREGCGRRKGIGEEGR